MSYVLRCSSLLLCRHNFSSLQLDLWLCWKQTPAVSCDSLHLWYVIGIIEIADSPTCPLCSYYYYMKMLSCCHHTISYHYHSLFFWANVTIPVTVSSDSVCYITYSTVVNMNSNVSSVSSLPMAHDHNELEHWRKKETHNLVHYYSWGYMYCHRPTM